MSKKVVFLGSKKIGLECLQELVKKQKEYNFEIVGVLTNDKGECIKSFCTDNDLYVLNSLDDYLKLNDVDILVSVQYHEILKPIHIKKVNSLAINLHMAPLPEYRGCNQFSYAIINDDKEFGTTIHKIDEGIDSGDILFEERFLLPENCWVEQLYKITFEKSIELFKKSLQNIINLKIDPIKQLELRSHKKCSIHYRKEIEKLKQIDLSWEKEKIQRYIRATYMPGFELPYTYINNKKVYFKIEDME